MVRFSPKTSWAKQVLPVKQRPKKALALFKTAEALGLDKMDFQHPANTYSFIELRDGDMVSRIVWGDASHPVGKPVEALFGQLNTVK
jgi:hypothetical protein